jgi:hypothetical protein
VIVIQAVEIRETDSSSCPVFSGVYLAINADFGTSEFQFKPTSFFGFVLDAWKLSGLKDFDQRGLGQACLDNSRSHN